MAIGAGIVGATLVDVKKMNPGMDWATFIDSNYNKTEKEREFLWNSCMFAAYELYAQGKMNKIRGEMVAGLVRRSHACIPSTINLTGN